MSEHAKKLLIVDDDPALLSRLKGCLEDYDIYTAENRADVIAELRRHEPAVILQNLGLPTQSDGVHEGLAILSETLKLAPHTKVIVVGGSGDQDYALTAVARGAYDSCEALEDTGTLKVLVDRAFNISELEGRNRRQQYHVNESPLEGIVAASEAMLSVCRMIERVAPTDVTTLLLGESGTGKELLSKALHNLSPRKDEKFVAINCAAIPENLLESELFGHEKGSFTGAHKQSIGKVEIASGGTLFLDEIGDMPIALQAKLLRFLQERVIERVGGREEIPVDVRVVCATNQSPERLIEKGLFREDLYYRVSEITINIPPFREREEGRIILARSILQKCSRKLKRVIGDFSEDAIHAIETYSWPGNVRELENKINGAVIMADGKMVTTEDLGLRPAEGVRESLNLREVRQEAESKAIRNALTKSYGNISKASESLGISRPTLYDLLNKYGLSAESYSKKAVAKFGVNES